MTADDCGCLWVTLKNLNETCYDVGSTSWFCYCFNFIEQRYSSFDSGIGARIMSGEVGLEELEKWIISQDAPAPQSGRQEMLENIINSYIY